MQERLQKIISAHGVASRRAAEKLILEGKVRVNGSVAKLGDRADPLRDKIEVEGVILTAPAQRVYIMLHKPRGYVTTMNDELGRKTVADLVRDCPQRVYPVGRLDYNSEGLLIMTNDGDVANSLMHPSFEVPKTYLVKVRGRDIDASVAALGEEMTIDGYSVKAASVRIEEVEGGRASIYITIREGRNRQVRKMCEKVGLEVRRLIRISVGNLMLGELKYGKWRYLTDEEIKYLRSV